MLSAEWLGPCQASDLVGQAAGGGHLVHGAPDVVADVRGRVEDHDAVGGGQERRHVDVVGDRVKVPLDLPDVAPVLVQGRLRDRRDGGVLGQAWDAGSARG